MTQFSQHVRKSAATARSIKINLGQEAYEYYKKTGEYDEEALREAISKRSGKKLETVVDVVVAESAADRIPMNKTSERILDTLRAGDIVRDSTNRRMRVQKVLDGGLRLHDPVNGARNLSWDSLEGMDLRLVKRNAEGPAARSFADLRAEAESRGIDTANLTTIKDIECALGDSTLNETHLVQIEPQLASDDPKKLQNFDAPHPWKAQGLLSKYWNNPNWVAEEKLDGVRLKLHFTNEGVRTDSRRRDTSTRRFSEKSPNFPHLLQLRIPELEGTILDSEGIIAAKSGTLPSGVKFYGCLAVSTAATNASPAVSREIQARFGEMQFYVFDILRYRGEDVTQKSYDERRTLLEQVRAQLPADAQRFIKLTEVARTNKLEFFENILASGGEGVILKTTTHKYEEGKRSKNWQKLKKFQEVDAFVTGFIPGRAGNEGLVGALELSVRIDGKDIAVAAVSQLTGQQRLDMTDSDGTLKSEYYNRVVTFRGQELTKTGRFRHAVLVGFRTDKTPDECDGYEIAEELRSMGLIKSQLAQETAF